MFVGASRTHVSWIPKFPAHESAHGLSRGALTLWITPAVVPNLRDSPVCGNFVDTFLEIKIRILLEMQGPLTRPIQESNFSNCFKLVEQAKGFAIKETHMSEQELMSFIDVAKAANIPLSSVYYFNAKGLGPATVKIGRHL